MIIMQHPSTDLLASSPHILKATQTTDKTSERVPLPPKNATVDTIEDTYVQFILACNPGIPLKTDTSLLRAAFRTPPKSGGKSFSTWILFQLIAQFQNKEIKTWGELALKLGVEPPDQEKGQSSQKIQQYAVRLKVTFPFVRHRDSWHLILIVRCALTSSRLALDAFYACRCFFRVSPRESPPLLDRDTNGWQSRQRRRS